MLAVIFLSISQRGDDFRWSDIFYSQMMCTAAAEVNEQMNPRSVSVKRHHQGWPKTAQEKISFVIRWRFVCKLFQLHNITTALLWYILHYTPNEMESKKRFKIKWRNEQFSEWELKLEILVLWCYVITPLDVFHHHLLLLFRKQKHRRIIRNWRK